MPLPKKDELIWIAGFYEGEGCAVCLEARKNQWSLVVSIAQKERQILDWIRNKYGFGSVLINKQNCHHWQCYFQEAKIFLESIIPYMRVNKKIEQVRLALEKAEKYIKYGKMTGIPMGSKLNPEKVIKIRELYGSHNQRQLAEMFGVCQPNISKIINNVNWK